MLNLVAAIALAPIQGPANLKDHSIGAFKKDVVELIERKAETPGRETLFADRYGYRYFFANEANRRAFLAAPERYEVQLGGACGSMGPLSGRGSTERFAVHAGKLYVFASDGCRTRFLANADRLVDRDAPRPSGTAPQLAAGRSWVEKAVTWCGGSSRVDGTNWYRELTEEVVESGGNKFDHSEVLAVRFPGEVAMISKWNSSEYSSVSTPKDGFFAAGSDVEPMHPVQRRAMERVRDLRLLTLLKARKHKDFVAIERAASQDGANVEVWFGGTSAVLTLEPTTGKPLSLKTTGRGTGALVGEIVLRYTAFGDFGGLKLPVSWEGTFDGKPNKALSAERAKIALDGVGISFSRPKK
ncbi:MAG: hypothetical protein HZC36_10825 [Armatimonadetes bacterium]|nr:hypothetical protein [Armatimonadota bacterium]